MDRLTKLAWYLSLWQRYSLEAPFLMQSRPQVGQVGTVRTFWARRYSTAASSLAKNGAISAKAGKPFLILRSLAERTPSAFLAGAMILWLQRVGSENGFGEFISLFLASAEPQLIVYIYGPYMFIYVYICLFMFIYAWVRAMRAKEWHQIWLIS